MYIKAYPLGDGGLSLHLDAPARESFKHILFRALNTWPDAPVEWKELSDLIEHGYVLQDYKAQSGKCNPTS